MPAKTSITMRAWASARSRFRRYQVRKPSKLRLNQPKKPLSRSWASASAGLNRVTQSEGDSTSATMIDNDMAATMVTENWR